MENISLSTLAGGYSILVDAIIRPPRLTYDTEDLGPKKFRIGMRTFERTDLELKNDRNLTIQVSHYQPIPEERIQKKLPCVIYCHGNCGCRLDALDCLRILLPYNITLVSIDFTGSGLSDGEYVSLGHFEKEDLGIIINYLRKTKTVSRIALWGRSMGAATSIMYVASDPSIACMVLDSPFTSLNQVAKELVENTQMKLPGLMVTLGLKMIRKTILGKAKFDINKLAPIEHAHSCFIPSLFAHGKSDTFIPSHHSQQLHDKYAGDKNVILVDGDHNSMRPRFFYDSVTIFFHNFLLTEEEREYNSKHQDDKLPSTFSTGKKYVTEEKSKGEDVYNKVGGPTPEEMEEEMLRQAILLSLMEVEGKSRNENTTTEELANELNDEKELKKSS
eukprot:TRINITY_DN7637_c0_g1_i1.p1 TRINITY_DN7637_c0_g1~~TRINITY_DN7637_c0_g1_i1.p1  ORF type:complete len:389 (+),score=57.68 TRINITY_DN7637_c0_g1_i1:139-1305(+)